MAVNGNVSFWFQQIGHPVRRPPLDGPRDFDVCIVGAGYTGLWTAHYLKQADPGLRIAVLEREFAGFGASGRNGGWLSAKIPGSAKRYAQVRDRAAVLAFQRWMNQAVDEVIAVAADNDIEADVLRSGYLRVAHSPAQLARLAAAHEADRRWGHTDQVMLSAAELADRVRIDGALGAVFNPHCARINPAKLVVGLAELVERSGVTIYESTPVTRIEPGAAHTPFGVVRAERIVRATEGYTPTLAGERRSVLPMNSSMIVTEPLPAAMWDAIGWAGAELLSDQTHAYMYGQRTADGRIAVGGRGNPYRFGGGTNPRGTTGASTVQALREVLTRLFPSTATLRIDHAWSGVLAVPRDWCASISFDRRTGLARAGGYTGQGVAAANLAARTMRDLLLGRNTELTRLPWVDHPVRRWEPEPLRWLGVQGMYAAYRAADRAEFTHRTTTSPIAKIADLISGR
ncbi:FAD-dependent oxidoreductase [Saccharopolyspora subtropica]|uniref:FAD-dependent oxidoreductase n=1 Tax=Saccharopolyspora thermophila TaxID=89367 RepID=A0A917JXC3_9PSEU|nr:FAD-dependent oxidoreductase [Saccharopolyspora subtropica]GGI88654.1 FAD-dependent oxidoreductase [Saccharopolyspora subtropica]